MRRRRRLTEGERQVAYELQRSNLERTLEGQLRMLGVPTPRIEFRFHETRGWRFDFAWPGARLAVEVEGLTAKGGRHQTLAGFRSDCEKYNAAAIAGWRTLRYTAREIQDWSAAREIVATLAAEVP